MKHLVLGNGPAGVVAAETLRRSDPEGDILLVGSEDAPPYSHGHPLSAGREHR